MRGWWWLTVGVFLGAWVACVVGMFMAGSAPMLLQRQVLGAVMMGVGLVTIGVSFLHGPRIPIRITESIKPGTYSIVGVIYGGGRLLLISEHWPALNAPKWTVHWLWGGDVAETLEEFGGQRKLFLVTPHERISGVVHVVRA